LTYRIAGLPAIGTLYQFTNGVRSGSISSSNTPLNDGSGRIFFMPATNHTGSPDAICHLSCQ
jgi:hypothetical protein